MTERHFAFGVLCVFVIVEIVSGCGFIPPRAPVPPRATSWHFPTLIVDDKVDFEEAGLRRSRVKLRIGNPEAFPRMLFQSEPQRPPCEPGGYSSRLKAELFAADGTLLWTGCDFKSAGDLKAIWVALPADKAVPHDVYIRVTNRRTGEAFVSPPAHVP